MTNSISVISHATRALVCTKLCLVLQCLIIWIDLRRVGEELFKVKVPLCEVIYCYNDE